MTPRSDLLNEIEKALTDEVYDGGLGALSPEQLAKYVHRLAEVAADAVEQARTPTDDEREALAEIIDQTPATPEKGQKAAEFWAGVVDAIIAAGFRRTVQGEPTEAQVTAALNAYWQYDPPVTDPTYWSEKHRGIMRAALRAAAEARGEGRA